MFLSSFFVLAPFRTQQVLYCRAAGQPCNTQLAAHPSRIYVVLCTQLPRQVRRVTYTQAVHVWRYQIKKKLNGEKELKQLVTLHQFLYEFLCFLPHNGYTCIFIQHYTLQILLPIQLHTTIICLFFPRPSEHTRARTHPSIHLIAK